MTKDKPKFDIYQHYGRAKDMPKRMRKHFKEEGIKFHPYEWVHINEYVHYSLENRWGKEDDE